jgi:3',5'-cyclic AMP phosphodiesterase CpdA
MTGMNRRVPLLLLVVTLGLLVGCPKDRPSTTLVLTPATKAPVAVSPSPSSDVAPGGVPTPVPGESPTVALAVGDIVSASSPGDEATAKLLDSQPGAILALGDNVYENGTESEFQQVFDVSWGRHKSRIRPVPGNHEYNTPEAAPYYKYFGAAAGEPDKGFYAYDLGPHWRVLAINSELENRIAASGLESRQLEWVESELKANSGKHVMAVWHHPRYSSGIHGDNPFMDATWDLLVKYGAELVLAGHDHEYERFAPMDQNGKRDETRGLRSFVVGTGGGTLSPITDGVQANSEAHDDQTWGVLKVSLYSNRYTWEFLPIEGKSFRDQGEGRCH